MRPLRLVLFFAFSIWCNTIYAQSAYIEVATTTSWYRIMTPNRAEPDGHAVYRKYSLLLNTDSEGNPTITDIRNTISYNCAIDENKISYLTFYIPREIELEKVIGQSHLPNHEMRVELRDKGIIPVSGEVVRNEVYIDHVSSNSKFFRQIEQHQDFILWLNENFGAMYFENGQSKAAWLSDVATTFDEFIADQLKMNSRSGGSKSATAADTEKSGIQIATTEELFALCK